MGIARKQHHIAVIFRLTYNSEEEQVEKDQADPVDTSRQSVEHDGPGSKHESKSSIRQVSDGDTTLKVGEVTEGRKDGESTDEGKHRVAEGDDARVQDGGFVSLAVGSIGSKDSKRQTNGEKDLGGGDGPDFTLLRED